MVQPHVHEPSLEGVLQPARRAGTLLAPVAAHQLVKRQIAVRDEDDRVVRDEQPLAPLRRPPHHHVGLLGVPPARADARVGLSPALPRTLRTALPWQPATLAYRAPPW